MLYFTNVPPGPLRFKRDAGRSWTRGDPWWCGEEARKLRFGDDGVVYWGTEWDGGMYWRLTWRKGAAVLRVRHDEFGSFPGHVLRRHSNWGFIWHSPWVVYASFPLRRATDIGCQDRHLAEDVASWQWREVDRYNSS